MRKSILLLVLLLLGCVFVSCADEADGLVKLSYIDEKFVSDSGEHSYLPAPVSYEPTSVGAAYAYYKKGNITMYKIGGADPLFWLTEEYADSATTVFYSDTITLPTLDKFGADKVYVCVSEERTYAPYTIEDSATIEALIDCYLNGETAEAPYDDPIEMYDLKFSSPEWPMIYISLEYEEYESGAYLYDRLARRYIALGDLLTDVLSEGET